MRANPNDVLSFWFSQRARPLWFQATAELDREILERFLTTYEKAARGELGAWEATPAGATALVIVLDQFPLNMFRARPESFATEAVARAVAGRAIERSLDAQLPAEQRAFLYLPFMHSEDLIDQDRCVKLCERAGLDESLKFACHHRDIIRRFGRFPHRNAILGRDSTLEELQYLSSTDTFRG